MAVNDTVFKFFDAPEKSGYDLMDTLMKINKAGTILMYFRTTVFQ